MLVLPSVRPSVHRTRKLSSPFWAYLSLFRTILANFWSDLIHFRPSRNHLQTILACFGHYFSHFTHFGAIQVHFGLIWTYFGTFWQVLAWLEQFLPILGPFRACSEPCSEPWALKLPCVVQWTPDKWYYFKERLTKRWSPRWSRKWELYFLVVWGLIHIQI